jgi:hypothetical protein
MRSIFLSPHPDDAVLSCGGWIDQLAQNGERPLVLTVFGGDRPAAVPLSAFARSLHERWQLGDDARPAAVMKIGRLAIAWVAMSFTCPSRMRYIGSNL